MNSNIPKNRSSSGGGGGGEGTKEEERESKEEKRIQAERQRQKRTRQQRALSDATGAPPPRKTQEEWIPYDEDSLPFRQAMEFIRTNFDLRYKDARGTKFSTTPGGRVATMHTNSKSCQNLKGDGEHNGRTVYFVFNANGRHCYQRCGCTHTHTEGRIHGPCKTFKSESVALPPELSRLLFGTQGERTHNTKRAKVESDQRFAREIAGHVLSATQKIRAFLRQSNGGHVPNNRVLPRKRFENTDH